MAVFITNFSVLVLPPFVGPGGSREISAALATTCIVSAGVTELEGAISTTDGKNPASEFLDFELVAITGWHFRWSHSGKDQVCSRCDRILKNQKDILY